MMGQLAMMAREIDPVELERAKNMLKSSVLMNLESRAILCEDIARQVSFFIYSRVCRSTSHTHACPLPITLFFILSLSVCLAVCDQLCSVGSGDGPSAECA